MEGGNDLRAGESVECPCVNPAPNSKQNQRVRKLNGNCCSSTYSSYEFVVRSSLPLDQPARELASNPKKKSKRGLGSKEEVLQKSHTRIMLSVVAVVAAVFGLISLVSFTFLRIGSLHNEKSVILKDTVGVGSIKETIVQTPPQGP